MLFLLTLVATLAFVVSEPLREQPFVVDISYFFSQDQLSTELISQVELNKLKLVKALREHGAAVLVGHGISDIDSKMEAVKSIFKVSDVEKQLLKVSNDGVGFNRGYLPFGSESGLAKIFEPKEGFSYGYPTTVLESEDENLLSLPNRWSESLESSQVNQLENLYLTMTGLGANLGRLLLAEVEKQTNETIDVSYDDGDKISLMRLFHYIPTALSQANADKAILGSSPHTDWGFLTLILQNNKAGLQFLHNDNWIDVPYVPQSLIINAGDFLSLITDNFYHSPVHRVIANFVADDHFEQVRRNLDDHRYSCVLFYYPNYQTEIKMPLQGKAERICDIAATGECNSLTNPSSNDIEFNTLLNLKSDLEVGERPDKSIQFGEYITKKWRDVFRSNY